MSNQSTYLLPPRPFAALPCPSDAVVPATAIATNDVTQGALYGTSGGGPWTAITRISCPPQGTLLRLVEARE